MSAKDFYGTFVEAMKELAKPILMISTVVAFAYVTNASGMSTTLGMTLAKSGDLFPFFAPVLGWLGVFITGSDTSANLLFGSLQKVTALKVGMEPVLALAANSGGVTGKMISIDSDSLCCRRIGGQGIGIIEIHA